MFSSCHTPSTEASSGDKPIHQVSKQHITLQQSAVISERNSYAKELHQVTNSILPQLRLENSKLRSKCEELESKLKIADSHANRYKTAYDQLEKDYQSLYTQNSSSRIECENCQSLQTKINELNTLYTCAVFNDDQFGDVMKEEESNTIKKEEEDEGNDSRFTISDDYITAVQSLISKNSIDRAIRLFSKILMSNKEVNTDVTFTELCCHTLKRVLSCNKNNIEYYKEFLSAFIPQEQHIEFFITT